MVVLALPVMVVKSWQAGHPGPEVAWEMVSAVECRIFQQANGGSTNGSA